MKGRKRKKKVNIYREELKATSNQLVQLVPDARIIYLLSKDSID